MSDLREGQAIGLAGAVLATRQALQLARTGRANDDSSQLVLAATLRLDADTAAAVYGGREALRPAFLALRDLMITKERDPILVRSLIVLMQLERNFSSRRDLREKVASGIAAAAADAGADMPARTMALGELYASTVSLLTPRVMIPGDPELLAKPEVVTAVRAHLLAALRGMVLWRQSGGTRIGLVLGWRPLRAECERLLALR